MNGYLQSTVSHNEQLFHGIFEEFGEFIEDHCSPNGGSMAYGPPFPKAEQLLGGETCETDFLESSDWPLRRLDLHLSGRLKLTSREKFGNTDLTT